MPYDMPPQSAEVRKAEQAAIDRLAKEQKRQIEQEERRRREELKRQIDIQNRLKNSQTTQR